MTFGSESPMQNSPAKKWKKVLAPPKKKRKVVLESPSNSDSSVPSTSERPHMVRFFLLAIGGFSFLVA